MAWIPDPTRATAVPEVAQIYYEGRLPISVAAELEFVPTSTHRSWRGKYRCMWCKRTGYTWEGCTEYSYWWGNTHGKNCRKRPKP
jgi:hypothetical protein